MNHILIYGAHNEERLTGLHETCSIKEFRYGVSDRGASIRIPMQTANDGCGYLEDRSQLQIWILIKFVRC